MESPESADVTTGPSEVERLQSEVRREHDMYLRALADFENYRRRMERELAGAGRGGKRDVIVSLLDVLDTFDNALAHIETVPSALAEGVQAIHRKLLSSMERHGVIPFESVGHVFDPRFHEAVGSVPSEQHAPGTVVDEVRRGYVWGDELLRPARVRVAQ
jgi:molecular chaperone GrpE